MARTSAKNAHKVNVKAKASEARPGCPTIRLPWERHRCSIDFDPDKGRTHQSFRDECDIQKIIDLHTRTGMVTHLNPGEPQFGEAPDSTLFEAAVVQAEIRSAIEDGWEPPADDNAEADAESDSDSETPQAASEAVSEPEEGDRSGE